MTRRQVKPPETYTAIAMAVKAGRTPKEVASEFDVSVPSVYKACRRYGIPAQPSQRKFSTSEAWSLYEKLGTCKAVAAVLGVVPQTICKRFAQEIPGWSSPHGMRYSKTTIDLAVKMYAEGESMSAIGAATGMCRTAVRNQARLAGVPIRPPGRKSRAVSVG
jgi:transposase-like protein